MYIYIYMYLLPAPTHCYGRNVPFAPKHVPGIGELYPGIESAAKTSGSPASNCRPSCCETKITDVTMTMIKMKLSTFIS